MAKIVWDQLGERFYENGVSQGVFYQANGIGVPWNGLVSVDSKSVDEVDPLYFDGLKYDEIVALGDFEGTLKAFTYPDEFLMYEGLVASQAGFFLAHQPKKRFGLCYRTEIHNDLKQSAGYKLHLLYNVLAVPADKSYETMSLDVEPGEFEWDITAIPEDVDRFRPTAYVVIDSRKIDPYLLQDIEEILYGNDEEEPSLPDLNTLVTFVMKWGRLIITRFANGVWQASSPLPDVITMLDSTTFQIVSDTAVYLDADTYEISSSDKNMEDIWPP